MSIFAPESIGEITENDGQYVEYNGQKYTLNQNITSILLIGVDKQKITENINNYGESGQADFLVLVAVDTQSGKIKFIPISRDSMVDINMYSESGNYIGTSKKQICLSYAYGDGKEMSCQNTVKSVSRFMYGMPINSYFAMDIEALKALNDYVGGVTITADEDMTLWNVILKKGETFTLKGNYAVDYIRYRGDDLNANNSRMARQKNYMKLFYNLVLEKTKKDITFPVKLFNIADKYKITDIDVADLTFLTNCILKNKDNAIIDFSSIPGNTVQGEEYVEFYPDTKKLYELILDTYYIKN